MAKKDEFRIEWEGLDALAKEFEEMSDEFQDILIDEYSKYGKLVEEGSKALSHHDEGDLEDSINFDKAKIEGETVTVEGGANAPYAWRRHEEPERKGTYDKYSKGALIPDYYVNGRGEGTRGKSDWRGYKPGRKYMENAIKATEKDYNEMNERILARTLGDD